LGGIGDIVDANRTKNIGTTIDVLSESLTTAWCYLQLLGSLRDAYHTQPKMNGQFGRVINRYWQALWDALFVRIGTYFDRVGAVHSLPGLLTQLRRTQEPALVKLATSVQRQLDQPNESVARLLRWRNEVIAHRSATLSPAKFDTVSEVHLDDVAAALELVQACLNELSHGALGFTTDIKHWHPEYSQEAAEFLELVEGALDSKGKNALGKGLSGAA
jgi:hypothetical protein